LSGGLVLLMVGDELLDGRTRDTNSEWIIDRTREAGWHIAQIEVIADDVDLIASAISRHSERATAILVSGGLGPTCDDLTRDGLALAMGAELEFDTQVFAHIEALFVARGRPMSGSNRRQAMRPSAARVIDNPVGTAPGLLAEVAATPVALLPGVPTELKAMFEATLMGQFAPLLDGSAVPMRRLRTTGIAESTLADMVEDALSGDGQLDLAYCVSTWGVDILLRDPDPARLQHLAAVLHSSLDDLVFGERDSSLPGAVLEHLRALGQTVAVAESCTGGLLGAALTSVPGSSEIVLGGVIAYPNALKESLLDVPAGLLEAHGAVSEEIARAMARGVCARTGADWGISTTGVAGPGGGTKEKPVGMVCVGLCGPGLDATARSLRLSSGRDSVRRWSVATALDALRRGRLTWLR